MKVIIILQLSTVSLGKKKWLSALFVTIMLPYLFAQAANFFPFSPSWNPATNSIVNLSYLNKAHPLERLVIDKNAHFADSLGRVRLVGTNVTEIPEKKDAQLVARRLSSLGINIIRLHHLDSSWGRNSLYPDSWSKSTLSIDPVNLDKLDYFIAALAAENIMANFNFLTGRNFNEFDKLPADVQAMANWKAKHSSAMYRPEMIALHKKHIAAFLSHTNPYRGMTYAVDPVIAMAEVINENGLVQSWHSGWLDQDKDSDRFIKNLWNKWLKARFANQAAITQFLVPGKSSGETLFDLADFKKTPKGELYLESYFGAEALLKPRPDGGITIEVKKNGTEDWHVQLGHSNISVKKSQLYTLTVTARSSTSTPVSLYLGMADEPWSILGFSRELKLTTQWQSFSFPILPSANHSNARVVFSGLGLQKNGLIEIKESTFSEGGSIFSNEQTIENQNIDWPRKFPGGTLASIEQLWLEFLYELEEKYWTQMSSFIKKECGYQGLLIGSIVGTSTHLLQSSFDIIDAHAYFNHPEFTQTEWDNNHYFVRNRAMVKDPVLAIMSDLAFKRLAGKPFIVSEIDQPDPNQYSAELFPILAAYASAQDWDGWFSFNFNSDNGRWDNQRIAGFFDNARNSTKVVAFQTAALAFRRQDFAVMPRSIQFPINKARELEILFKDTWGWDFGNLEYLGFSKDNVLRARFYVTKGDDPPPLPLTSPWFEGSGLNFDSTQGLFTALSERSIFYCGFFPKETTRLGSITFSDFNSRIGFGFISVQSLTGSLSSGTGQWLVTALVSSRNSDMEIKPYPGKTEAYELLTTRGDFGKSPVLCETPSGTISFVSPARSVAVWALDEQGNHSKTIAVTKKGNNFSFKVDSQNKTLWYEVLAE